MPNITYGVFPRHPSTSMLSSPIGRIVSSSKKNALIALAKIREDADKLTLISSKSTVLSKKEKAKVVESPLLAEPSNDRDAGRKSTGLRRSVTICGLTEDEAKHFDSIEGKGGYLLRLIREDLSKV
jgi:hypothetical protein